MTLLSDIYGEIAHSANPRAALESHAFTGLTDAAIATMIAKDPRSFYRGKVRDLIIHPDHIEIVHSDRLTAFDRFMDVVPYKGVILNTITNWWLTKASDIVETHLIRQQDDRTLVVKKTTPVKVEVVVRGYLAGSMARAYAAGAREICGVTLPEGLSAFDPLPEPIITPTTKAPVGEHDESITHQQIIERGLCSPEEWQTVCQAALKLFELGTRVNDDHGWILVDTKYEFGKDKDGRIILIDEIHTPDCSRFWVKDTYGKQASPTMLDKEIVRRYLLNEGFDGHGSPPPIPVTTLLELAKVYLQVAETLTGKPLSIQ